MDQQTEQLLEYLREASQCAGRMSYSESAWTLTEAIKKVLHPSGLSTAEHMTFLAQNLPRIHGSSNKEELFQSSLQKARALAEKTGRNEVVALIDDAASIKFGIDRVAQKANPEVVKAMGRGGRLDQNIPRDDLQFAQKASATPFGNASLVSQLLKSRP